MTDQGPMERPFTVQIATITARDPMRGYVQSLMRVWEDVSLGTFAKANILLIPPALEQCGDIPLGRNRIVAEKLQPEKMWDAILWIDDDQVFGSEVVLSLVDAVRRGCVDIVVPLIARRTEEHKYAPVAYEHFDEALGRWITAFTGWEQPELYEMAAVGTGMCLVKREVFEKMPDPWYERTRNPVQRNILLGNDLFFCNKAKALGFRCWLDSRVEAGHMQVEGKYVRRDFCESGLQQKLMAEMRASRPLGISKKTDVNTADFWDEWWKDERWITLHAKRDMYEKILPRIPEGSNVFIFGTGDGTLQKRIQDEVADALCFGVDISPVAISHCRRKELMVKMLSDMNMYDPEEEHRDKFDILVIAGWLERLVAPGHTLKNLIKVLKPKGQVVVGIPNLILGPDEVPEHHHLLSEMNVGELLNRFGRVLERQKFDEVWRDTDGRPMRKAPMIVMRSTVEKEKGILTDAAESIL